MYAIRALIGLAIGMTISNHFVAYADLNVRREQFAVVHFIDCLNEEIDEHADNKHCDDTCETTDDLECEHWHYSKK